jgi:hypothetical protein
MAVALRWATEDGMPLSLIPLAVAGKLFVLWLLGVPGGLLLVIFLVMRMTGR